MQVFLAKLSSWNQRMNGIPRKGLLTAFTLLCAFIAISLFPYCWPFVVAMVFSLILDPFVRLVSGWFHRPAKGRTLATLLGMLLLFGMVAVLLAFALNRLWAELMDLVKALPGMMRWVNGTAVPWLKDLYDEYRQGLPPEVVGILDNAIASLGQTLAGWATSLTRWVSGGAWATAMSLVDVILSVVLTIMGTYYLTADKRRIAAFFERTFPQGVRRHGTLIKNNLIRSLFGQVRSQLKVSLIIITFLVAAFMIYGLPYGLLMGLGIGVADALPVVGAGLFLIPLSILSFVLGDVATGVFMACVYVVTIVIRQVFEPRIVGKQLGLYPLATMIAMYAGYRMFGFLGLLGGPILLNLIKVVLEADKVAGPEEGDAPSVSPSAALGTGDGPEPPITPTAADGAKAGDGYRGRPLTPGPVDGPTVSENQKEGLRPPSPAEGLEKDRRPQPSPINGELTLPGGKKKPFRVKAKGGA